ncbi:MAG: tetratricopeptide repeat protein [Clostridiaceae bacterium]|nr:tetratricopeptide repeat protein [Clostridiaceae bacterium]
MKKRILCFLLAVLLVLVTGCGNQLEKQLSEAEAFATSGDYESAIEIYKNILEENPQHLDSYLGLFAIYRKQNKIDLAEEILQKSLQHVENKLVIQKELMVFYMEETEFEKAEEVCRDILYHQLEEVAYENLLRIYTQEYRHEDLLELFYEFQDQIDNSYATVLAMHSHMFLQEREESHKLLQSLDVKSIEELQTLVLLVDYFRGIEDREAALKIVERGLEQHKDAYTFQGLQYALTEMKDMYLVDIKTADVNGDGILENIMLFSEEPFGSYSDAIWLVIQKTDTGEIIEKFEVSYGGYVGSIFIGDLNRDGIDDFMFSVHSGGSGGLVMDYAYSYRSQEIQDLLENFSTDIEFQFKNDYKVEIYCAELERAFEVSVPASTREIYAEEGYYYENFVLNPNMGYLEWYNLDPFQLETPGEYGIRYSTFVMGDYGSNDTIAEVTVDYVWSNNGWQAKDIKIEAEEGDVKEIGFDSRENRETISPFELLGKNQRQIRQEFGEPISTGTFGHYYMEYKNLLIYFDYNDRVSTVEAKEVLGTREGMSFAEAKAILGMPQWEGNDEYDDQYRMMYSIGNQYEIYYGGASKDKIISIMVK